MFARKHLFLSQGILRCNSHILQRPVELYTLAATGKRFDRSNQRGGCRPHVRSRRAPCCFPCPKGIPYHPDLVVSPCHGFPVGIAIYYSASVSNPFAKTLNHTPADHVRSCQVHHQCRRYCLKPWCVVLSSSGTCPMSHFWFQYLRWRWRRRWIYSGNSPIVMGSRYWLGY